MERFLRYLSAFNNQRLENQPCSTPVIGSGFFGFSGHRSIVKTDDNRVQIHRLCVFLLLKSQTESLTFAAINQCFVYGKTKNIR